MSTRKRGRVSNKNIEGGRYKTTYDDPSALRTKRTLTQKMRDYAVAPLNAAEDAYKKRFSSSAAGTPSTSSTPFKQRVGQSLASGASAVKYGAQALGSAIGSKFSRNSTIAQQSVAGKIKPDNLLVPMVINLEQNKVLLGSNIYPIVNGIVSDDTNTRITVYNAYIESAKQQILTNTKNQAPTNEEIESAVRDIVRYEFLDKINKLIATTADPAELIQVLKFLTENSNQLGFNEFYDIFCIATWNGADDSYKVGEFVKIKEQLLKTIPKPGTQTSAPQGSIPGNGNELLDTDSTIPPVRTFKEYQQNESVAVQQPGSDDLRDGEIVGPSLDGKTYQVRYTDNSIVTVDSASILPREEERRRTDMDSLPPLGQNYEKDDTVKIKQPNGSEKIGKISLINGDGTYNVKYTDETTEDNIPSDVIESYNPMGEVDGGGARRLKKTRKHRKRSKRKTAHYLT